MEVINSWTESRANARNIFSTGKAEEKTYIKKTLKTCIRMKNESEKNRNNKAGKQGNELEKGRAAKRRQKIVKTDK